MPIEYARGFLTFYEQVILYTGEVPPPTAAVAFRIEGEISWTTWHTYMDIPFHDLHSSSLFPFQIVFRNSYNTFVATPPIYRCISYRVFEDLTSMMEDLHQFRLEESQLSDISETMDSSSESGRDITDNN